MIKFIAAKLHFFIDKQVTVKKIFFFDYILKTFQIYHRYVTLRIIECFLLNYAKCIAKFIRC